MSFVCFLQKCYSLPRGCVSPRNGLFVVASFHCFSCMILSMLPGTRFLLFLRSMPSSCGMLGRSGSDNPLAENVAGFFLLKVSLTPTRFRTFGVGEVAYGRALVLAKFLDSRGRRCPRTGLPPCLGPGRVLWECLDGHSGLSSRPRGWLSTKWQRH